MPIYLSKRDTGNGKYTITLKVIKKATDYDYLQVAVENSLEIPLSTASGIRINNTNSNIVDFRKGPNEFITFDINNLIKTQKYFVVLNTVRNNPRVSTTPFSARTARKYMINVYASLRGGLYTRKRKSILKKNITKKHK